MTRRMFIRWDPAARDWVVESHDGLYRARFASLHEAEQAALAESKRTEVTQ